MRSLIFLLVGLASLSLTGYLYLKRMGLDAKGMTISQNITLAFVRRVMTRIADAEREQVTVYSECASLDQLISEGKVRPDDQSRGDYSFSISCDAGGPGFTVTGMHAPVPMDSPVIWPVVIVDKSMVFRDVYH